MFKMLIEDKYYAFTLVTSGRGDVQEHSRGEEAGKYVWIAYANGPPWCDRSLDSGIGALAPVQPPHAHIDTRSEEACPRPHRVLPSCAAATYRRGVLLLLLMSRQLQLTSLRVSSAACPLTFGRLRPPPSCSCCCCASTAMSARFNDHLHLRRGVAEDDAFLLQPHLRHCDSPQASWYRLLLAQFVKALTLGAAS